MFFLGMEEVTVICFSDATHASLPSGASQGAYIVFLRGRNGKVVPISWQSKKLSRITKSPLASETLALSEVADAGFLIASLMKEICALEKLPKTICITDNSSLKDMLETTRIIQDKRLRVDVARLRELTRNEEIKVVWLPKEKQLADCLTKYGASADNLLSVLQSSNLDALVSNIGELVGDILH